MPLLVIQNREDALQAGEAHCDAIAFLVLAVVLNQPENFILLGDLVMEARMQNGILPCLHLFWIINVPQDCPEVYALRWVIIQVQRHADTTRSHCGKVTGRRQ